VGQDVHLAVREALVNGLLEGFGTFLDGSCWRYDRSDGGDSQILETLGHAIPVLAGPGFLADGPEPDGPMSQDHGFPEQDRLVAARFLLAETVEQTEKIDLGPGTEPHGRNLLGRKGSEQGEKKEELEQALADHSSPPFSRFLV
jgi:hypothetical protein